MATATMSSGSGLLEAAQKVLEEQRKPLSVQAIFDLAAGAGLIEGSVDNHTKLTRVLSASVRHPNTPLIRTGHSEYALTSFGPTPLTKLPADAVEQVVEFTRSSAAPVSINQILDHLVLSQTVADGTPATKMAIEFLVRNDSRFKHVQGRYRLAKKRSRSSVLPTPVPSVPASEMTSYLATVDPEVMARAIHKLLAAVGAVELREHKGYTTCYVGNEIFGWELVVFVTRDGDVPPIAKALLDWPSASPVIVLSPTVVKYDNWMRTTQGRAVRFIEGEELGNLLLKHGICRPVVSIRL